MQSKKILAFFIGISIFGFSGIKCSVFTKEFSRYASWPISIVGHSLFWPGLLAICSMKNQEEVTAGLAISLLGAAGVAGGRALHHYANAPENF